MTGISNLGIGYSFDAAGNRTGDGRITYAYNYRGRMNQVRIINGAVTNTYDYLINGINLRVRKTGPSTVVPQGMQIFVYDDAAKLIGEYDDLGRARIEHVWLEDRPIAAITYTYTGTSMTPATTTTSYVETDHLATPRLITNASGRSAGPGRVRPTAIRSRMRIRKPSVPTSTTCASRDSTSTQRLIITTTTTEITNQPRTICAK